MCLEPNPAPLLRHSDAYALGRAMLTDHRIGAFHQTPRRWLVVAAKDEYRRAHPALHIDAMDIADFRQHTIGLVERMSEAAQRNEVIGDRKFTHPIQLRFHD